MKIILATLTFLLSTILAFGQVEENVQKFHKTGVYQYVERHTDTQIKRTKRRQVEYNKKEKKKLILKVKWVSDNEYWLIFIREKNNPGCLKKGYIIKTTITAADENGYACKYTSEECRNGEISFVKLK